jgi:hypothetical protein
VEAVEMGGAVLGFDGVLAIVIKGFSGLTD